MILKTKFTMPINKLFLSSSIMLLTITCLCHASDSHQKISTPTLAQYFQAQESQMPNDANALSSNMQQESVLVTFTDTQLKQTHNGTSVIVRNEQNQLFSLKLSKKKQHEYAIVPHNVVTLLTEQMLSFQSPSPDQCNDATPSKMILLTYPLTHLTNTPSGIQATACNTENTDLVLLVHPEFNSTTITQDSVFAIVPRDSLHALAQCVLKHKQQVNIMEHETNMFGSTCLDTWTILHFASQAERRILPWSLIDLDDAIQNNKNLVKQQKMQCQLAPIQTQIIQPQQSIKTPVLQESSNAFIFQTICGLLSEYADTKTPQSTVLQLKRLPPYTSKGYW